MVLARDASCGKWIRAFGMWACRIFARWMGGNDGLDLMHVAWWSRSMRKGRGKSTRRRRV